MANTILASTNLFVARSWLIPLNRNEIQAQAILKVKRLNAESAPLKQAVIPCLMVLGSSAPNNDNMPNMPSEEMCRWGPQCPVCVQYAPHPRPKDSNWEEEDWNGDVQKAKREEKQRKEEELKKSLKLNDTSIIIIPKSAIHITP